MVEKTGGGKDSSGSGTALLDVAGGRVEGVRKELHEIRRPQSGLRGCARTHDYGAGRTSQLQRRAEAT